MQLRQTYLKLMARIIPVGAVGASLLLGSALSGNAAVRSPAASEPPVSERLAAIREAVFVVVAPEAAAKLPNPNLQLTWGNRWNNWGRRGSRRSRGWGRPWNNWNNFWRNW